VFLAPNSQSNPIAKELVLVSIVIGTLLAYAKTRLVLILAVLWHAVALMPEPQLTAKVLAYLIMLEQGVLDWIL
jgi:hypothetical protein